MKRKFFKNKLSRNLFLLCFGTLILIPTLDIFYIYPLFHKTLFKTLEEETELSAKNLLRLSLDTDAFDSGSMQLPQNFDIHAQRLVRENELVMLKVYDKSGKIIYCTKSEFIGTKHPENFFYDVVTKGNCLTQFISRSDGTLEHKFLDEDVVESYIPLMKRDQFCGAFEIYHDVTESKSRLDAINAYVCTILMVTTFGLIAIVAFVGRKLEKTQIQLHGLTQAVERSPHGVLIMNAKGVIEAVNPKFIETTGYSSNELIGKNLHELYMKAPKAHREIWDAIALGKENYLEWENKKKGGEKYWVRSSIVLIRDENGVTSHVLGIFEDITEQKRAETILHELKTTYESILDSTDYGVFTIDNEGTIISFSKSLEKLFGYESIEIIGQNITDIFPSFPNAFSDAQRFDLSSYLELGELTGQLKNGMDLQINLTLGEINLTNRTVYAGLVRNLLN